MKFASLRVGTGTIALVLPLVPGTVLAQDAPHEVVPFESSEQGIEVVSGDPSALGESFVLRIYNDAGFVVWPHTHPEDEHIVVIEGTWALGEGSELDSSTMERMEIGDYAMVPKEMAHFAHSVTATTIQVHGVGPFLIQTVHPVYELTEDGVGLVPFVEQPADVRATPDVDCFQFEIGERVQGDPGEGIVVGAHCTPEVELTQYWVEGEGGTRFWATSEELSRF